MNPIQRCPPAAAQGVEPEHQFFGRHQFAVSAHAAADGEMVSTGVAFEDYSRMQTTKSRSFKGRARFPVPDWAKNPATVRAVLVQFFEERAFSPQTRAALPEATEATRLKRAFDHIQNHSVPKKLVALDRLCHLFVEAKQRGENAVARRLAVQIEGIDTFMRAAQDNMPAVTLSVIYRAYNLGESSVEIGEALYMKPPHVRQLLKRLNECHKRMTGQAYVTCHGKRRDPAPKLPRRCACGSDLAPRRWKCDACRDAPRPTSPPALKKCNCGNDCQPRCWKVRVRRRAAGLCRCGVPTALGRRTCEKCYAYNAECTVRHNLKVAAARG